MIWLLITLGLGLILPSGIFAPSASVSAQTEPGGASLSEPEASGPAIRFSYEKAIEVVGLPSDQLSHLRKAVSTIDWFNNNCVFSLS